MPDMDGPRVDQVVERILEGVVDPLWKLGDAAVVELLEGEQVPMVSAPKRRGPNLLIASPVIITPHFEIAPNCEVFGSHDQGP
ncbi:hypothetical protein [Ferrimicrobium acidiphilum]|uniref:hypothetical protein n=1 Tax=Ferrimicrobium acidiphilum TaxID=121039 RepID=UPI0023F0CEA8|nr:hypothetical protein [Ferrimicrobium acidiphilum]